MAADLQDIPIDDGNPIDPDIDPTDVPIDHVEETGDVPDIFDPVVPECMTMPGGAVDLGVVVPMDCPPTRPGTECGPDCRQVGFTDDGVEFGYDVKGGTLVFTTRHIEDAEITDSRLVLVDLSDGTQRCITRDQVYAAIPDAVDEKSEVRRSAVWGNTVIFVRRARSGGSRYLGELFEYDLGTNHLFLISRYEYDSSSGMREMELCGRTAVLTEDRTEEIGGEQILTLDLGTRERCIVSTTGCCAANPECYGDLVVFDEGVSGSGVHIYLYDGSDHLTRRLTSGSADHLAADVWQDLIVWTDMRNGGTALSLENSDIFGYRTSEFEVSTHSASQLWPSVWQDRVVWLDCRNDHEYPTVPSLATQRDIYMYDTVSGEERHLVSVGRGGSPLILDGSLFFLMRDESSALNVFEMTIPE